MNQLQRVHTLLQEATCPPTTEQLLKVGTFYDFDWIYFGFMVWIKGIGYLHDHPDSELGLPGKYQVGGHMGLEPMLGFEKMFPGGTSDEILHVTEYFRKISKSCY